MITENLGTFGTGIFHIGCTLLEELVILQLVITYTTNNVT